MRNPSQLTVEEEATLEKIITAHNRGVIRYCYSRETKPTLIPSVIRRPLTV
ncbi:MAG: hypothetical protein LBT52_00200 [Clostridiales Family XIII bacterium]|jgi:hypothetical protein|nr:hypothetical protein [Clostridiales Family XIII bacterium]